MSFTTQFLPSLPRTVSTNHLRFGATLAAPKFGIDGPEDLAMLEPGPWDKNYVEPQKAATPAAKGGDTFQLTNSAPKVPAKPVRTVLGVKPTSVKALLRRVLTSPFANGGRAKELRAGRR